MKRPLLTLASVAALLAAAAVPAARAQTAYGVDATGLLYSFPVANASQTNLIGNIGFTPAGIDFNPLTGALFGLEINASGGRLYNIDLSTAVATPIGAGPFALSGTAGGGAYNLTGATAFGFDFNPKTVQTDNSIRIRLFGNDGANVRLNANTGVVSNGDGNLTNSPGFVGAAYTNNFPELASAMGATTLYDINAASDSLFTQIPPNTGTTNLVGTLNIDIGNASGFDIFTAADGTTNTAYLVADVTGAAGSELYTVNLGNGAATLAPNGATIGSGLNIVDIAVQPIPEPSTYVLTVVGALTVFFGLRRRRSATV